MSEDKGKPRAPQPNKRASLAALHAEMPVNQLFTFSFLTLMLSFEQMLQDQWGGEVSFSIVSTLEFRRISSLKKDGGEGEVEGGAAGPLWGRSGG